MLPQQCDLENHYLFITLKQPFQTECQGPCYLTKEELDLNLSPTNSKHLLTYVEMNCMCDLKSPFQAFSQTLTEFSNCCSAKKCKYRFRGPAQLSSVFISHLMYTKWSLWFKIILCNAKQGPRCFLLTCSKPVGSQAATIRTSASLEKYFSRPCLVMNDMTLEGRQQHSCGQTACQRSKPPNALGSATSFLSTPPLPRVLELQWISEKIHH